MEWCLENFRSSKSFSSLESNTDSRHIIYLKVLNIYRIYVKVNTINRII